MDYYRAKRILSQVKIIDIKTGKKIILLNKEVAEENDIYIGQRVGIKIGKEEHAVIVDLTEELVRKGEVGIFKDIAEEYGLKGGEIVEVFPLPYPISLEAIRKKINGYSLSKEEIESIISDLMRNRLSEAEIAAFIVSSQIRGLGDEEVIHLINAMVNSGEVVEFKEKPILDKHSIGGVAGNRTTMLIVPIVAALNLKIPKTSSRAITSPAGTADTMEVLAEVEFSAEELKEIVEKVNGAIVWGGGVNIAPADDYMIRIRRPLRLDPQGILMASILAKKKAVSASHVIVDIPIGSSAKIEDFSQGKQLGKYFQRIGEMIGMKIGVVITDGSSPIGNGVGPSLECRDILRILRGDKNLCYPLMEKSALLAGKLLELSGKATRNQGYEMAMHVIKTGKALKKMKEIIEIQGGDPNVKEDDLPLGSYTFELKAPRKGRIKHISNKAISKVARDAGAPKDKGAGIEILKNKGDVVKRGDIILRIYSESESKLGYAIKALEEFKPVVMDKILLEEML